MSLGKDLASIRKSQNLSLEDIQNAIKIPMDTLESIEDDSIFSDPSKNKTYIRSFVRSYAKVLKIEDEKIVQALDEVEEGNYSGDIFKNDTSAQQESTPSYGTALDFKPSTDDDTVDDARESAQPKKSSQVETSPAPAPTPATDSINWADMGKKFSAANTNSKIWIVTASIAIIVIIVGSGIIFSDNIASFFSSDPSVAQQEMAENPQTEQSQIPAANDSVENESQQNTTADPETASPSNSITLGDTLTIDVYAAYDKLDPVRVTSDFNWQTNPFWMEEGQAYKFDFRDSLLVRGQYRNFLLLFNGHVIQNPRQNYFDTTFNSILITRSILEQPAFLAPPPEEFPLDVGAPDSSTYRIRF
ncbi:helix-turn-helix domain-containing protein [Gracilimonas sp.]|uniref:helix-turn-helix domain-containing protein n=1 Tax=Gracilimonas sp. TaxID=1974203 RepID=UPI00287122CE|nr:helix-turn-helix domain-containing protein [Gracilimonas sp.]